MNLLELKKGMWQVVVVVVMWCLLMLVVGGVDCDGWKINV